MFPKILRRLPNAQSMLDAAAAVAITLLCGTLLWHSWFPSSVAAKSLPTPSRAGKPSPAPPTTPVSLENTHVMGSAAAPVAIIEFADIQCPYCAVFNRETLPAIEARYVKPGKALFAFHHAPLEAIHPSAFPAAEATECADAQGAFWQMQDLLFRSQKELDDDSLIRHGQAIQLDPVAFRTCLGGAKKALVRKAAQEAADLHVTSTPTFFVGLNNGKTVTVMSRMSGVKDLQDFEQIVDEALDRALARAK